MDLQDMNPAADAAGKTAAPADAAAAANDKSAEKKAEPEKSPLQKKLDALRGADPGATAGDETETADDKEAGAGDTGAAAGKDEKTGKPKAAAAAKDDTTGADDETKPLLIKVPGRTADDEDVELPLDRAALKALGLTPKEAADRIGQLRNGFARRQALEADQREVDAARTELDFIGTELTERPVDFIVDRVAAKQYLPIAVAVIERLSDADFTALIKHVAAFDADPSERKLAAAKAREATVDRREKAGEQSATEKKRADYVNAISEQITSVVPDEMPEAQANELYELASFKLQQWAKRQPQGTRLDPAKVPALLEELGVLKAFDLSLEQPETGGGSTRTTPEPPARSATPAKKPAPAARDTGKDLQERHDRRKNAVTAPAGAGAAAASSGPPKGQTFKDRIAWLRGK